MLWEASISVAFVMGCICGLRLWEIILKASNELQGIQYLATVTERGGKVYAFFVKSPTKASLRTYTSAMAQS